MKSTSPRESGRRWAEETVALVPAAGSGTRLGLGPKAFLEIGGRSLIRRVVDTVGCLACRTVVGVPPELMEEAWQAVGGLAEIHAGGASRQETIFILLSRCSEEIVVIHDATRPFASSDLVRSTIEAARMHGAAAAYTPAAVPMAHRQEQFITSCTPTAEVLIPQSPQAYRRDIMEQAYSNAREHGIEDQTTLELVLRLGTRVLAIPGEAHNIKITTPLDWEIANRVVAPMVDDRTVSADF